MTIRVLDIGGSYVGWLLCCWAEGLLAMESCGMVSMLLATGLIDNGLISRM